MTSSDPDRPPASERHYNHNESTFNADISAALLNDNNLDNVIRTLYSQGYGKLLICRGLDAMAVEEPQALKRRVIRVINQMITEHSGGE